MTRRVAGSNSDTSARNSPTRHRGTRSRGSAPCQLALHYPTTWGGARRNAGRKPGPRANPRTEHGRIIAPTNPSTSRCARASRRCGASSSFPPCDSRWNAQRVTLPSASESFIIQSRGSRSSRSRGRGSSRLVERTPWPRYPCCTVRERSPVTPRAAVGRSLASACAEDTARSAQCAALCADELSQARTTRIRGWGGSLFVRRLVRWVAGVQWIGGHAAAFGRATSMGAQRPGDVSPNFPCSYVACASRMAKARVAFARGPTGAGVDFKSRSPRSRGDEERSAGI